MHQDVVRLIDLYLYLKKTRLPLPAEGSKTFLTDSPRIFADVIVYIFAHLHTALTARTVRDI